MNDILLFKVLTKGRGCAAKVLRNGLSICKSTYVSDKNGAEVKKNNWTFPGAKIALEVNACPVQIYILVHPFKCHPHITCVHIGSVMRCGKLSTKKWGIQIGAKNVTAIPVQVILEPIKQAEGNPWIIH